MAKFLRVNIVLFFLFCLTVNSSDAGWYEIYNKTAQNAKGWKYIVIHHSATDAGNARGFHRFHTDQGWGGLTYHFVIGNGKGSIDGKVEEGFRWKEQISGTHVDVKSWYHNIFGIGICLVGNFEKSAPTKKQMDSLVKLVRSLQRKYHIKKENIIGHHKVPHGDMNWDNEKISVLFKERRFAQTKCPGKYFPLKELLDKLSEL